MKTSTTFYVTGLMPLILLIQSSSSQTLFNVREKQDALIEVNERFNFFDLELLKSLASSMRGNLLLSPVSVKAALAMILEGAGGKSAKELKEALRLTDDVKATRTQFRNFLNSLQANTPGTKLEAANQIFLSQTIIPHPQYETMLKNYYLSNIEKVDFSRPGYAAQAINRWVNMLTHGLIPTLVEPGSLSANTKLMIANAMYFKGKWKNAFDFDKTSVKCFFVDVNVCLDTYLMESVNFYKFAYIPSLHAHAVELPYEGEKFSLMLLLPTAINGIEQLVRDLTHISLHTIVSTLRTTEILISVPRFQIDFDTDLVNTLNELGVREIFSTNANLSGIVQGATVDLHIANVLHKAKINVTEEGTIATAATGTVVVPLMGTALPKLIFNHPFLFFLRNMESGDILFAGRLSEPEPAKPSPSVFDTGFPASAQSTSKPISIAVPSHSTFNPLEPVVTSSIPTNPIGSTDNSKFQSPQVNPNPNNFFYSPRTINDTPVVPVQNLPTPTTGINGNNQVQRNVVQYQPDGMYRVGQYSSHSSSSGTYNLAPTQNVVPVVTSNTNNGQFKSLSNESPQIGNNNANPNYNDRYLFS